MDRIEAAAEQAGLPAGAVERNAEREHLALPNQLAGRHDVLRRDVIERAAHVVLAPAPPVGEPFRGLVDLRGADGDGHCVAAASYPSPDRLGSKPTGGA